MTGLAYYLHLPFCRQRCSYCDFNTWAGLEHLVDPYVAAMATELCLLAHHGEAHTLYFGGGTPSLLPAECIARLIAAVPLVPDAEVSLEANPGTVDPAKLEGLRQSGVNRLSFGMQSADPSELALLNRLHDHPSTVDAVRHARKAGFDNLNLDLIYGLPYQTLSIWQQTLDAALALQPEHLSLYALTIEPGTRLAREVNAGRIPEPDADLAADMYDLACTQLHTAGFEHYEISNWALPGYACQHNLYYWRNLPYLGVGAGAWGHWPAGSSGWRMRNVRHPQAYIDRLGTAVEQSGQREQIPPLTPATDEKENIDRPIAMAETMFMGLRLLQEGVVRSSFAARFGVDPCRFYRQELDQLAGQGWVEWDAAAIRLRPEAIMISNQVFVAFMP